MFRRRNFSPELATKCRFCGCPVVDDCVSLSTVDAAKLSNWSVARTGVPIAEESAAASWSCMNCVREAKRICEMNPLDDQDCVWWDELKDRYFNYYKRGWMKSCSVAVPRIPEDQVIRLLDCSHEIFIKQEVLEEEQEVEVEEHKVEVKVEILEAEEAMEVDLKTPESIRKKTKKKIQLCKDEFIAQTSQWLVRQMACSLCNFVKPTERLSDHVQIVSCEICSESFPCKGLLSCHQVDCLIVCPLCSKGCKTSISLDHHLNWSHKLKTGYWYLNKEVPWSHFCSLCNRGYPSLKKLVKHEKLCRYKYYIYCDMCGVKKLTKNLLVNHLQKEHNFRFDQMWTCLKCDKEFVVKKTWRVHKKACQNQGAASLVACNLCGDKFEEGELQRHTPLCLRQSTYAKYILICQICGENFYSESTMFKHLSNHHNLGVLPLQCVYCKINMADVNMRREHYCPSRPMVPCSECNLVMYEENLFRHQVVFKCCKCDVSFPCEYLFKQHITERPYPCLICGKVFCAITSLTNHVHSEHDEDKEVVVSWRGLKHSHLPYKCDACKIYFETLNALGIHLKRYHKMHHCGLCAKMFAVKSKLKEHVLKVHTPELYFLSKDLLHKMIEFKYSGKGVYFFDESLSELEPRTSQYLNAKCHVKKSAISGPSFTCSVCGLASNKRKTLVKHLLRQHSLGHFDRKCPHCTKNFSNLEVRKGHICANRPKVECVHCNHTMFEEYFLEHTLEETCTNCRQTYPCEISFNRHTKGRSFPCSECGQFFCNMDALAKHAAEEHLKVAGLGVPWLGTLNSEKNLRCQECRRFFKSSDKLQRHFDIYHGGEVCSLCALWMPSNSQEMAEHIKKKHLSISPSFKTLDKQMNLSVLDMTKRNLKITCLINSADVGQIVLQPIEQIFKEEADICPEPVSSYVIADIGNVVIKQETDNEVELL